MKTNKLWSIMMMLVLVLGTAIAFSSCSNDDEDDNGGSSSTTLLGTWQATLSSKNFYQLTFEKKGKVIAREYVNGELDEEETLDYSSDGQYITIKKMGHTISMKYKIEGDILYLWQDGPDDDPIEYKRVK